MFLSFIIWHWCPFSIIPTGTHLHFFSKISALCIFEKRLPNIPSCSFYSHSISMIKSPQSIHLHDPPHHFHFLYWYSSSLLVRHICFQNRLPNIPIQFPWLNLSNMYTSVTLHIISTSSPNGIFHFGSLLLINHFSYSTKCNENLPSFLCLHPPQCSQFLLFLICTYFHDCKRQYN